MFLRPPALLLLLLLPISAFAQTGTLKGSQELSLFGSLDFQGPSGDDVDIRLGYGWYHQDDLLFKWNYNWIVVEDISPAGGDYRSQQGSFATEYLFNESSNTKPYIGIDLGWRNTKFGSVRESGLVIGPKAGIRMFLNDSVSIDSSISFRYSNEDVFIVDQETSDTHIFPGIGINATF